MESTGSPAREPDNQERQGILESPNSKVAGGSGVQSNPSHQASVSGQKQDGGSDVVSSRTRKKTTVSLTEGQRGMAIKQKKAKSQKPQGIKTSSSGIEGLSPDLLPVRGRGVGQYSPAGKWAFLPYPQITGYIFFSVDYCCMGSP